MGRARRVLSLVTVSLQPHTVIQTFLPSLPHPQSKLIIIFVPSPALISSGPIWVPSNPTGPCTFILCYFLLPWRICWHEVTLFHPYLVNTKMFWKEDCFYDLPYNTGYQIFVLRLWKTRDEIMKCSSG